MKGLNIRSLAITGVFLLMMVSGVSVCGRQTQNTQAGIGAAPQQGVNSGDELRRWQATLFAKFGQQRRIAALAE